MKLKLIRRGIYIAALAALFMIPAPKNVAAEEKSFVLLNRKETADKKDMNCLVNVAAEIRKQGNKERSLKTVNAEDIKFNNKLLDKVFVKSEGGQAYVYAEPVDGSDWVGKVSGRAVVKIVDHGEEWSKVKSGNVEGYVKTENLVVGSVAIEQAKQILVSAYPQKDIYTLSDKEINEAFSFGETKEEEAVRVAAEEEVQRAAREAIRIKKSAELIAYAKQFIGNPYVYGGTSLTNGTDCSGFVKGVYKHFGVSLPRTSSGMRRSGYRVSVQDMQPGDIVCYEGHVGIYAGNGKIVNAIDERKGIGMSNAFYKPIITVRRIF